MSDPDTLRSSVGKRIEVFAEPELTYESNYCSWHEAIEWDCHCGREIPVQIRVYRLEDVY